MSKTSSILMWVSALLLCGIFLFPLWKIDLHAPQYPDGLGIRIWISQITGRETHDLQNINGLNHYIGMKAINPDSIPELKFMKFIGGFLVGLALITAAVRRRWLLIVFVLVALVIAGVGLYDFWKWEYEYGHELDPSAAIKVPGMTYQPPIFGTKQLLNFTTTAWPGIGGWCAMLAVALAVLALLRDLVAMRRRKVVSAVTAAAVVLLLCLVPGCAREPRAIEYGTDACVRCKMVITDQRYGSELVTRKGRVYIFDSVECLVASVIDGGDFDESRIHGSFVTAFHDPGTLIDASTAGYLVSERLPSPMGMNLTAFQSVAAAEAAGELYGGEVVDWEGLRGSFAGRVRKSGR
jgi:copper chaperone NosL